MAIAPAIRSGAASANVRASAANSNVPLSSAGWESSTLVSRISSPVAVDHCAQSRCGEIGLRLAAANVHAGRMIDDKRDDARSGSRVSRTSSGLLSAAKRNAKASSRSQPPRARRTIAASATADLPRPATTTARAPDAARSRSRGSSRCLMSHALEQCGNMHLVGLVIAGERIHHHIDAKAHRQLALLLAAR